MEEERETKKSYSNVMIINGNNLGESYYENYAIE